MASRGTLFDQRLPAHDVAAGVEEHALGLEAVASGAAGLLLVVLDRFGHGGVDDGADIAAVDAHAERDGRDDDVDCLAGERLLCCGGRPGSMPA